MALASRRYGRSRDTAYYWPGFVDAMAQLLLVITFMLSVFMIAQFLLARQITGQDTVLSRLRAQIAELTNQLALQKANKQELEITLSAITNDLKAARAQTARLQGLFDEQQNQTGSASARLATLQGEITRQKSLASDALAKVELLNQQSPPYAARSPRSMRHWKRPKRATELQDDRRSRPPPQCRAGPAGAGAHALSLGILRPLAPHPRQSHRYPRGRRPLRVPVRSAVPRAPADSARRPARARRAGDADHSSKARSRPTSNWVLRVDGHTDNGPISTPQFPSNWELSTARAIAVVRI